MLLEHARAMAQPQREFRLELGQAVDAVHVAAEGQVARRDEDVLGPEREDCIWMSADQHARIGHAAQQVVQPAAPPAAFDGVAPGQHHVDPAQLRFDFIGEVVVVHGRARDDACGGEGLEQGREPALGRVGPIAHRSVTRIQQGDLCFVAGLGGVVCLQVKLLHGTKPVRGSRTWTRCASSSGEPACVPCAHSRSRPRAMQTPSTTAAGRTPAGGSPAPCAGTARRTPCRVRVPSSAPARARRSCAGSPPAPP